jgi:hypothetical protein
MISCQELHRAGFEPCLHAISSQTGNSRKTGRAVGWAEAEERKEERTTDERRFAQIGLRAAERHPSKSA